MLNVKTWLSFLNISELPLPWWTSKSIIKILFANPLEVKYLAATATSLKTQNPAPSLDVAWWLPPAVLHAMP